MKKGNLTLGKKIAIGAVAVVVVAAAAAGIFVTNTWGDELATLSTLEKVRERNDEHLDGDVYMMKVKGDFYLDEFVAQGGVKSDTELINFVTEKLTKGLIDMGISAPEIGCSSFTAKTEEGDVVFGRNYDLSKTNTCLVFTEASEGRHATMSTVDLKFLGIDTETGIQGLMDKITCLAAPYAPLDGMNDAGVSCGIYMTYQGGEETVATNQDTDKPDLTSTTLLRMILDYADTVEEAVEIASSYDMHDSAKTSYHYMVADASGKSAILEWSNGDDASDNDGSLRTLNVIYNDDDAHIGEAEGASDYQWVTNFVLQPGCYDNSPAEDKKGFDRYERIYEELSAVDGIVKDDWGAMEVLAAVGRRSWNNDDKNRCTVHSAVYNLTDKTITWVPNENFDDASAVFTFDLSK